MPQLNYPSQFLNATSDGLCKTIRAQYWKTSCANFYRKDGLSATAIIYKRKCRNTEMTAG